MTGGMPPAGASISSGAGSGCCVVEDTGVLLDSSGPSAGRCALEIVTSFELG